jgi:hypothetical protein
MHCMMMGATQSPEFGLFPRRAASCRVGHPAAGVSGRQRHAAQFEFSLTLATAAFLASGASFEDVQAAVTFAE